MDEVPIGSGVSFHWALVARGTGVSFHQAIKLGDGVISGSCGCATYLGEPRFFFRTERAQVADDVANDEESWDHAAYVSRRQGEDVAAFGQRIAEGLLSYDQLTSAIEQSELADHERGRLHEWLAASPIVRAHLARQAADAALRTRPAHPLPEV